MNKKLMALAVASAMGAPAVAVAQVSSSPGITLYGVIDDVILDAKYKPVVGPELKKGILFSVGSRVGVRGREDLGGGTSVWFQAESGVNMNGRNDPGNLGSATFGGRNSAIGITNTWGDLSYGMWDSPYKLITDTTYTRTTVSSPN